MKLEPVAIRMENVSVTPANNPALNGFTAAFASSKICGLTGPNGSGTSTVANILGGDYKKHKGEILVFDVPAALRNQVEALDLGIGIVRQQPVVIPRFSVLGNLAFARPQMSREARKETAEEINTLALRYGIPLRAKDQVDGMGGADQQWVDVLRILFSDPAVVVFDQTEVRLGPAYRNLYVHLLESLKDEGKAVVVISHDPDLLAEVADEVVTMEDGRVTEVLVGADLLDAGVPVWPELGAGENRIERPPLVLSEFGTTDSGLFDVSIDSGQVVGIGGPATLAREQLLKALGGAHKAAGSAYLGDRRLNLRNNQSARASGVQYIEPDLSKIQPAEQRSLSAMITPESNSWLGRLIAKKDQRPTPAGILKTLIKLQKESPDFRMDVVVLDRPMLGLDTANRDELGLLMRKLANSGALVLFATDSPREQEEWCDTVANIEGPGSWSWG